MRTIRLWWALHGPAHPLESGLAWLAVLVVPAATLTAYRMGWASFSAMAGGLFLLPALILSAIDDLRLKRGAPPVRLRFR